MSFFKLHFSRTFVTALTLSLIVTAGLIGGTLFTRRPTPQASATPEHFLLNKKASAVREENIQGTTLAQAELPSAAASPSALNEKVLGDSDSSMYFTAQSGYSNGGVLVLNAGEPAEIQLNSYSTSGNGKFTLYKANKNDVLNYLLYKRVSSSSWGMVISKIFSLDTSKLTVEKTFEQQVFASTSTQQSAKINLGLSGTGAWFLLGDVNGKKVETMLVRSNLGAIVHKGNNEDVFWVQDSGLSNVSGAAIELFNAENTLSSLQQLTTGQDGLVTSTANGAVDVALVSKGEDFTLLPIQLYNLNQRAGEDNRFSSSFGQRKAATKSFIFTDRFMYKPGDTINFKAILRNDDDADYSIIPRTVTVQAGNYDRPFWQKSVQVSELGSVDGSIQIPKDTEALTYLLTIKDGDTTLTSVDFSVAQFRKPDATIAIQTNKLTYQPGETLTATITGEAFLGQPLRDQEVRYKLYKYKTTVKGDLNTLRFSERLQDFQPQQQAITEGSVKLNKKGIATFTLPVENTTGYRQFWTLHIESLDAGGSASDDVVQALVNPGDFIIEQTAAQNRFVKGVESAMHLQLSKNVTDAEIKNIPLTARLMVSNNSGGFTVEQDGLKATTDAEGKASISFVPKQRQSYQLEIETKDKKGNLIKDDESLYAQDPQDSFSLSRDIFTVTTDKELYNVGDTAKISIKTDPQVKNIFVSIGRSYSRDFRTLPVTNGIAAFDFQVIEKYQPNVYVAVGSFEGDEWKQHQQIISVNTLDKKVSVKITPEKQVYGPGETATFEISATDGAGQPVKTDLAFWVFDKSLLELHGAYFEGIFRSFWDERSYTIPTNFSYQGITSSNAEGGGGCFVGDTPVTMADGAQKEIQRVRPGDLIQTFASPDTKVKTSAKVIGTHEVKVDGYLILNGEVKVTPEHKLFVNKTWKTAGEIMIGDRLLSSQGAPVEINSIEWVRHPVTVYNLYVEKFHTFFADGIYVHNEKGDARSVFKDTAYWNAHVATGDDGKAKVSFVIPDNLTTWVTAAVAANGKTQVGDGKNEFIVTKDVVMRPVFPLFLRVGDEVRLTSILHNFTKAKENFAIDAQFTGGELSNAKQTVAVDSEDSEEIAWPVKVTGSGAEGVFTVKAQGSEKKNLVDSVTEKMPIYPYGTWMTKFDTAMLTTKDETVSISPTLSVGTDQKQAELSLELTAARYPQLQALLDDLLRRGSTGGTNEASGAIVAATIFTEHGKELGLKYDPAAVTQTVQKAVKNMKSSVNSSGVFMDSSHQLLVDETRFAIESLSMARDAGLPVDGKLLDPMVTFVKNWSNQGSEQQYMFSLLPKQQFARKQMNPKDNGPHAAAARAIIANARQGFVNSTADESFLLASATENERQLSWKETFRNGKTWEDIAAPTVWSARAMSALKMDPTKVAKSLDYLYRNDLSEPQGMAQLALATVEYYQATQQGSPNYQYTVKLGDKVLKSGQVTSAQQAVEPLKIRAADLQPGAILNITKTGSGVLHASLTTKEYFVSKEVAAQQHTLTISRKYLSSKPAGEPTKPGDLVIVQFDISGLGSGEKNIEIEDYLPSGLVAIDQQLKNGNFDQNGQTDSDAVQQITEQGMKLNFMKLFANDGTYSYKTRVISQGQFDAPPATVKLTSDPSIWANTTASRLVIDGKSSLETLAGKDTQPPKSPLAKMDMLPIYMVFGLLILSLISGIVYNKREQIRQTFSRKTHGQPPVDVPPTLPPKI